MKTNLLTQWYSQQSKKYETSGYIVEVTQDQKCTYVDLISDKVSGRICFWPPDVFEFQFHHTDCNDPFLLETERVSSILSLDAYVSKFVLKK